MVLEAFEDYWGGAPAVKRIIFRTIPEALNRTIGLETGEVDLAYDLGITDLESLAGNESVTESITTLTSPSTTVWYVGMNVQKAPFDNEKVRQAVAYALDPQGYIDLVFGGEATPANYTMLPPSVDGYISDCSEYSYNVEKAKELLTEAGYPDGFSTTLWCSGLSRRLLHHPLVLRHPGDAGFRRGHPGAAAPDRHHRRGQDPGERPVPV